MRTSMRRALLCTLLILALPTTALQGRLGELATEEAVSQRRLGVAIVPPRVARRLRRA